MRAINQQARQRLARGLEGSPICKCGERIGPVPAGRHERTTREAHHRHLSAVRTSRALDAPRTLSCCAMGTIEQKSSWIVIERVWRVSRQRFPQVKL